MFTELIAKTTLTLSAITWSDFLSKSWAIELMGELLAFALLLCFVGFSNLENRFPKITRPTKQMRQSYRTNIGLFIINSILMSAFSVSTLFMVAEHFSGYGLLNHIQNPVLKAVLAFVSIDLLLYAWHQACHRVDAFWVFHRVHHNDPYLNVSTAFRLHIVEILLTNILKALLIVIMGIDKMLVLAIETVVTLCIMFHHTNISFKHERVLGWMMIVPYLHRMHHSTERSEHDKNYGAVLSVWDRVFGSLLEREPKAIGIKGNSPQDLFNLIKFGFGGEIQPQTKPALPANLDDMIAEAAFYKAEKRNFYPGYEMRDWLEAKKEVLRQFNGEQQARHPSFWQGMVDVLNLLSANFNQFWKQYI